MCKNKKKANKNKNKKTKKYEIIKNTCYEYQLLSLMMVYPHENIYEVFYN